jgi:hypothetical protein
VRALLAALLLAAAPAAAQDGAERDPAAPDFAARSAAQSWGLAGEEKARFEATVVDILCSLTGDCPADCGGGTRQLGLLRHADDRLILPLKNAQPVFSGAALDLLPWCGARVEVDGLLVGRPEMTPVKYYQVQRIRAAGAGPEAWQPATRFTEGWAARHPEAAAAEGPWFRKDPRIRAEIARRGYLGLGPAADRRFIAEEYGE